MLYEPGPPVLPEADGLLVEELLQQRVHYRLGGGCGHCSCCRLHCRRPEQGAGELVVGGSCWRLLEAGAAIRQRSAECYHDLDLASPRAAAEAEAGAGLPLRELGEERGRGRDQRGVEGGAGPQLSGPAA